MALSVQDLVKRYGEKTVVDHLSFHMDGPGVYAILGTNGAGKTTALRMMLGMLKKDGGSVEFQGKPLESRSCSVGYLAEERGLYPRYALMDQLLYFAALRGVEKEEAKKRIRYWAERLELMEYLYPQSSKGPGKKGLFSPKSKTEAPKKADQLSKGNQQKIQFMTALLGDPELLVLDEPLSGLDPVNTDLFRKVIHEEIEKGKYLILSSHQMATVEEFCSDILILNRSKTILQGNLNAIKKSFGRVNLHLKTEQEIRPHIEKLGIQLLSQKEFEYQLKVTGETQANALLSSLLEAAVPVIRFDLREPSLHEIFVRKVNEANEEA